MFEADEGNRLTSIVWGPNGRLFASTKNADLTTAVIWDSFAELPLLEPNGFVSSLAVSPNGRILAAASLGGTVHLWDIDSWRPLATCSVLGFPTQIGWNKTSDYIVVACLRGWVEVWAISDPPRLLVRLYHTPGGSGFAATPEGYVAGPPEAREYVRFGDGWALYDLTDVPERLDPGRVAAALSPLPGLTGGRPREGPGVRARGGRAARAKPEK